MVAIPEYIFLVGQFSLLLPDGERYCNSMKLSYQELGVAKLRGFREWFSIHPLIAESAAVEEFDPNSSCHKMIIFAHHHKVLDGIQVRLSKSFHIKQSFCIFRSPSFTRATTSNGILEIIRDCGRITIKTDKDKEDSD